MSNAAPPINYALSDLEQPADRLLRRIIAWVAIACGGVAICSSALHVALSKGWLASPTSMSWDLRGGWDLVLMAAQTLTRCALVVGGVLMLNRSRASVVLLRAAAGCSIGLGALGLAMIARASPVYASYWSTPAAAAVNAMQFLNGLWAPVLILLLTLPPLARRTV